MAVAEGATRWRVYVLLAAKLLTFNETILNSVSYFQLNDSVEPKQGAGVILCRPPKSDAYRALLQKVSR